MPRSDWAAALRLAYPEPPREEMDRRFADLLVKLANARPPTAEERRSQRISGILGLLPEGYTADDVRRHLERNG